MKGNQSLYRDLSHREREMKTYYYTSQTTHYEPYLAHHGVKGMKWGVRHDAKKDVRAGFCL